MAKFTFIKADGTELDYATKSVVVEKQVTVKVSKSLWKGVGERLSLDELAALGISVKYYPDQTEERIQYERVAKLYQVNPDFATRVAEWKEMFDELELNYDATVADIAAAEELKFGDNSTARGDFHDRFMGKRTEVMVNYQAAERIVAGSDEFMPVDDYTMWTSTAVLMKWLPGTYEEADVPKFKEDEILESAEREAEIMAELSK